MSTKPVIFLLKWVTIKPDKSLNVKVDNSISLNQLDPPIDKYFPKTNKYDYVSKNFLSYNLYSYGVSFILDSIENTRELVEISVHYKLKEKKK
jgi:hypothetical protein